ncbi:hypothetical protein EV363DRAFT_1155880, partial [Boletus edulis]
LMPCKMNTLFPTASRIILQDTVIDACPAKSIGCNPTSFPVVLHIILQDTAIDNLFPTLSRTAYPAKPIGRDPTSPCKMNASFPAVSRITLQDIAADKFPSSPLTASPPLHHFYCTSCKTLHAGLTPPSLGCSAFLQELSLPGNSTGYGYRSGFPYPPQTCYP